MAGGNVLEINNRLPAAGHAKGIAVAFDEAVDKVDLRSGVGYPGDAVVVEGAEVAAAVIFNKFGYGIALYFVFSKLHCLFQILHNVSDGIVVITAKTVHLLYHIAVCIFGYTCIEAVAHGSVVGRILHGGIEVFNFFLGHTFVHIVCRSKNEVLTFGLVHSFSIDFGVEDYLEQFALHGAPAGVGREFGKFALKKIAAELGHKLVGRIVMMYAVCKPHLLEIGFEGLVFLVGFPVAFVVVVHIFEHVAYGKIVLAVLVPQYVAAPEGGFVQIVDKSLLIQRKFFETGDFVTKHFNVGKTVVHVVEFFFRSFGLGSIGIHTHGDCSTRDDCF